MICSTRKRVQPKNRMRENCTSGSVRGAPGNRRSYRKSPFFVGAEQREEPALWRLGYIRRDDPGRDALWTRVAERDAPLPASLNWEHHGWRIRVYAPDPDVEDCDIPF